MCLFILTASFDNQGDTTMDDAGTRGYECKIQIDTHEMIYFADI